MQRFDEPPALKNGSVIPITGNTIRHIPTLIIIWLAIIAAIPQQIRFVDCSLDFLPTDMQRNAISVSKSKATVQPIKPSSSPITVKIISFLLSGITPA